MNRRSFITKLVSAIIAIPLAAKRPKNKFGFIHERCIPFGKEPDYDFKWLDSPPRFRKENGKYIWISPTKFTGKSLIPNPNTSRHSSNGVRNGRHTHDTPVDS